MIRGFIVAVALVLAITTWVISPLSANAEKQYTQTKQVYQAESPQNQQTEQKSPQEDSKYSFQKNQPYENTKQSSQDSQPQTHQAASKISKDL